MPHNLQKNLATISNDLAKACFRLDVNEFRLILVAMAQMPKLKDGEEPVDIDPKQPYYITKDDFVRLGVNPATVAREIRSACSDLMSKKIYINTDFGLQEINWTDNVLHFQKDKIDELRKKYPNSKYDEEFIQRLRFQNLLDSLSVLTGSDDNIVARLVFSSGVINYISQLRRDFTKLNLEEFKGFSSFYSFRIYILLMRHKKTGWYKVRLDDFKFSLDISDKYHAIKDLKKWVLDVAIADINAHSPYTTNYKLVDKDGRSGRGIKVTHLKIIFRQKSTAIDSTSKPVLPTSLESSLDVANLSSNLTLPPVVETVPEVAISESDDGYIAFTTAKCNEYFAQKNITDEKQKENYTKKAIREDWYIAEYEQQKAHEKRIDKQVDMPDLGVSSNKAKELMKQALSRKQNDEGITE